MAKKDVDAQNRMLLIITLIASVAIGAVFIGIKSFTKHPYTIKENLKSNKVNNFYPLVGTEEE